MTTQKVVRGYRLDRPLGAGGMGSVYVAEKLATHQSFAVKFMQDHLVADAGYVVRFEREISALRAIRHPNVVDVFEWCLPVAGSNEPPFLVMELLDGEGLDQLLKRKPVLPVGMAVEITLQVLDGLAAAHAVGVIHRDLGPSNVFLEPQAGGKFRAKILDFGLARPIGEEGAANVTQEGTLMGKPAYVAPELFTGQGLDARSDLYAVGVMLYRMVTGRFPYRESASQMLWVERYSERHQLKEYPPPRAFNRNVPESLDAVIVRSMRRDPDQRYLSAREMQQALLAVEADILEGQETVMIQPSPRPANEGGSSTLVGRSQVSMARPTAPRRWLPVAAAVLALSCALVVGLLLLFGRDRQDRTPAAPPPADAGLVVLPPPPADAGEVERVHLVVLGVPPDAIVKVGDQALSGDPPEGDVPKSDREVDVVVAAQGFETFRTKITPDQHKTVRAEMQPIATTVLDLGSEPDAGAAETGPAPIDAGAPPRRDAGRPRDYGRRTDTAVAPPADAAPPRDTAAPPRDTATPRDAGRVPVDGAGRLPDDPFANARRLPEEAPF